MAKKEKFDTKKFIEEFPDEFILVSQLLTSSLFLTEKKQLISIRNLASRINIPYKSLSRKIDTLFSKVLKFADTANDTVVDTPFDTARKVITICNTIFCNYSKFDFDTPFDTAVTQLQRRKEPKEESILTLDNINISQDKSLDNINNISLNTHDTHTQKKGRPTMDEVKAHFLSKGSTVYQAEQFFYYYDARGWKLERWKSAAAGWINRQNKYDNGNSTRTTADLATELAINRARDFEQERNNQEGSVPDSIW